MTPRHAITGFLLAVALVRPPPACAQSLELLTPLGEDPAVWGNVYRPEGRGPFPAVALLYGSNGAQPEHEEWSRDLAARGYVSVVVHYFGEADTAPPVAERPGRWPAWQEGLRAALAGIARRPEVEPGRIALMGFSLGSFVAVSTAGSIPEVSAVVEFYGGIPATLEGQLAGLPPLLILHGEDDRRVPVSEAQRLHDLVDLQDGEVEMTLYPEARHAFNQPLTNAGVYRAAAAADAWGRTTDFLDRRIGPRSPSGR
jgi:carboxymethylenebutenolidase